MLKERKKEACVVHLVELETIKTYTLSHFNHFLSVLAPALSFAHSPVRVGCPSPVNTPPNLEGGRVQTNEVQDEKQRRCRLFSAFLLLWFTK